MLRWLKRLFARRQASPPPPCEHRYIVMVTTIERDGRTGRKEMKCATCKTVLRREAF